MKKKPTLRIRDAVNDLLERNDYTRGAEAGEMYLGDRVLVVTLRRPTVIEGQWSSTDQTVDLFDLMDDYQRGAS